MAGNEEEKAADDQSPSSSPPVRHNRRAGDMDQAGAPIWLITFTDVMGLMLTFFVMMFAMATPKEEVWVDVTAALKSEFGNFAGAAMNRGTVDEINLDRIDFDQALNVNYLNALLESLIAENKALANVRLIPQPGQLIVSLPQELLFSSGEAAVKPEGARALYVIGEALARIRNKIEITGHADPRPVEGGGTGGFESNWELSLARAASVAALLSSVGYEQTLDIYGYSSGRYQDMEKSVPDEAARMDLARRVDIVIMDHDGRSRERLFEIGAP